MPTRINTKNNDALTTKHVLIADAVKTSSINIEERSLTAVISKEVIDRDGEILLAKAFSKSLPDFARNPIFLWSHDANVPIGSWRDVRMVGDSIEGKAMFGNTDKAREAFSLYQDGHLKGFSVGFQPVASERRNIEIDGQKKSVRVFTEVKLLEVSAVSIPANPDALARSASGASGTFGGISELSEQALDQLKDFIDACVKGSIKETLNADPGGPLASFIQDVIEVARESKALEHDHQPDSGVLPDAGNKELAHFRDQLKGLLGV